MVLAFRRRGIIKVSANFGRAPIPYQWRARKAPAPASPINEAPRLLRGGPTRTARDQNSPKTHATRPTKGLVDCTDMDCRGLRPLLNIGVNSRKFYYMLGKMRRLGPRRQNQAPRT